MINQSLFFTGNDKHATPQWLFNELNEEFHFETDVCATEFDAKCARYFSPEMDGLLQDWTGVCWMNPPYGRHVDKWIKKAFESAKAGATVVGLLPVRTDTKWFHRFVYGKAEVRFLEGRLKFGSSRNSAPFPSMVIVWRSPEQSRIRVENCVDDMCLRIKDYFKSSNFV